MGSSVSCGGCLAGENGLRLPRAACEDSAYFAAGAEKLMGVAPVMASAASRQIGTSS